VNLSGAGEEPGGEEKQEKRRLTKKGQKAKIYWEKEEKIHQAAKNVKIRMKESRRSRRSRRRRRGQGSKQERERAGGRRSISILASNLK